MFQLPNETNLTKILFSHSYFYRFDQKQWDNKKPYPPLGTITAAAFMRNKSYEVALCDVGLANGPEVVDPYIKDNPNFFAIYDDGFNYLTKMCLTNMRQAAFVMAKKTKALNIPVIASSSDSTDHYEEYLSEGVDVVILGEAEQTLLEIVELFTSGKTDLSTIPGIAFMRNNEVVKTPKRPVMRKLDELPIAAWDLIDVDAYRDVWHSRWNYFSLNVATTRGCPFKCNWCAKPIYGNRYNSRSAAHVTNEIELLINSYKPDYVWMCDDIFGLKPGFVQGFRDELNARNLSIKYMIQSRADLLLEEDNIQALADSGLETVWIGAESGSQKILDAMDKGTKVEQIELATRLLKQKGIRVAFFLQFGYLGETKEDIDKTINMVKNLMPDEIGASVSYPLPGTKFFEIVKTQLVSKQNWTDSDDLDLMYDGTFSKSYYKKLHRYVHKVFQLARAKDDFKKLKPSAVFKYFYYQLMSFYFKLQMANAK